MRPFLFLAALCLPAPVFAETASEGVLRIDSGSDVLHFAVEIADEPGERARGLMFRDSLEEGSGMLFIYPDPRIASFWMKNTRIPLDMIFIAEGGTIVTIAENTQPFSLEPVLSEAPVLTVLEIEGGDAARLGIEVGDSVSWKETPTKDHD